MPRRTSVTFAGDEKLQNNVPPLGKRVTRRSLSQSAAAAAAAPVTDKWKLAEQKDEESCSEEENEEAVFKPSKGAYKGAYMALEEGESGVSGTDVYGFKSPKRKGQMANAASMSAQAASPPKTPKVQMTPEKKERTPMYTIARRSSPRKQVSSPRFNVKRTPGKSILKKSSSTSAVLSPIPVLRIRRLETTTPHRLRARNKQDDEASSDDSISSMSGAEEEGREDEEEEELATPVPSTPGRGKKAQATATNTPSKGRAKQAAASTTPKRGRGRGRGRGKGRQIADEEEEAKVQPGNAEEYFDAHACDTVTSDRTLSRLQTPRMDQEAVTQALAGMEMGYFKERKALYDEYTSRFNHWMYLVCNGYNLLFHGLGSKRHLLEDFRSTVLKDFNHMVVNGYFPSLTVKQILNGITEDFMEHTGSFGSPLDQCHFIKQYYECRDYEDFYLVIHNIDGAMLRPEKAQAALSALAQIRGFHIIASIDHINAPLIWDQQKASSFNWLWQDVTTYDAYMEETSYENSLLVQQSGALALSSLNHVMKSLPSNARGIFMLLAHYQLEHCDNSMYQGLAFPDMYQKCREAFLVNSDLTLRSQLTEFKDHKLIKVKKAVDGLEYLLIPLDGVTLREFIQQNEEDS